MGYTLNGMVLAKKDYFSKKKESQVYQFDMYDGNTVVSVSNVPKDIWDSIVEAEYLSIKCRVSAFSDDGRVRLVVTFIGLA